MRWAILLLLGVGAGVGRATVQETKEAPERVEVPGIENVFRLSPRLYSGGEPRGRGDFDELKKLGIKTVVSVDGSTPDVEDARADGIRYVHLPIGYDGVPREQALRAIKAIRTLPGPLYVHCHHGTHRGPALAAVCAQATEGWDRKQAVDWLKQAGTSPDYRGLYATVKAFAPPTPEELERIGTTFPEQAAVPELVEMMVRIDAIWDNLKASRKAGFAPPADHPDLDPPHEALQLAEAFREASRLAEVGARGDDFSRQMDASDREATSLHEALKADRDAPSPQARRRAEAVFAEVGKRCTACHALHRDN